MSNTNIAKKSRVKNTEVTQKVAPEKRHPEIIAGEFVPVFCDRIVNISLGPAISKLNMGIEVAPNQFKPTYSLNIPTHALVDAIDFISKTLEDSDVQQEFVNAYDRLKERMTRN
nr:hypothetical protein [uncultured Undibacterium sp.]